jgi:Fe-S-cluster formation regulator IscX/YfhJ
MSNLMKLDMPGMMQMAEMVSKSGFVPPAYQGKPANCLVAIQWGQEIGLKPMQALQNIAVVNGKPALYGDALLALTRNDPRCVGVEEKIENDMATCKVKRRHKDGTIEEVVRTFSKDDAVKAKLWNKQGPWQQYPNRMLQARARGFALRDAFPDALKGFITAEELGDHPVDKNLTVVKPVQEPIDTLTDTKPLHEQLPPVETPQIENKELSGFSFHFVNGKVDKYERIEDWVVRYLETMKTCVDFDGFSNAEKRTKLKELETINKVVMEEQMEESLRTELYDKRIEYNKYLGATEDE